MTSIDFTYPSSLIKLYGQKRGISYKISLKNESIIEVSLGKPQRGGQGLGKKHRVKEFYVAPNGQVFAEFIADDRSGHFYQYAVIGRLDVLEEEALD